MRPDTVFRGAVGAALLALALGDPAVAIAKDENADRVASLIAKTDGATKETAYRVRSVDEEYAILRARHLKPGTQSLVTGDDRHPYDEIEATDSTGAKMTIWFDIASFFGRGLGF